MMVFYLSRDQVSYFQSYKQYFVAIYIAFLGFPTGDLLLTLSVPYWFMQLTVRTFVTSGGIIAATWGYVATKLYVYPQPLSLKRILSRPFRPIFLIFLAYLTPMIFAVTLAWLDPSSVPIDTSFQLNYILEGISLPAVKVGPLLLATGGAIVAVFTIYPLTILSRRSTLVTDREVRTALRIIAVVFGMISATLILGIGISSFGISITGFTNLVSVALIIIAVRAFRKPTFLKAFLGVVPSLQSSPTATRYDQMVLIHSLTDDKFGPIAKYLVDGVNQRERIIYFYNGDVVPVDEGLSRHGIDVTKLMLKGSLRVLPLSSAYPSKTRLDGTPLAVIRELASEAKTLGNEGLRVILDYDDFVIRPIQRFVEHLSDPAWTSPDHRLHVLMAFDSSTFKGE
ncbi:MAG TPA: hypothetical protein VFV92_12620, partial [Candidatus Bathyarchaeia archaeon]|nr:hypothetical protein [Candidatus Bathyarchaeia archaeon]